MQGLLRSSTSTLSRNTKDQDIQLSLTIPYSSPFGDYENPIVGRSKDVCKHHTVHLTKRSPKVGYSTTKWLLN